MLYRTVEIGILFIQTAPVFIYEYIILNSTPFGKSMFVATLIVKDFNSHGEIKTDNTYMTNADTPYLATKDVIKDAKHPFTGKPLEVEDKNAYSILNTSRAQSTRIRKEKAFDVKPSEWFTVKDNIFIDENWSSLNK